MANREPDAPLKVSDYLRTPLGLLVAYDSGEFGGELWWFDQSGTLREVISRENTFRILDTPTGILALTGLAHLMSDEGHILKLTPASDGWQVKRVDLPGAPQAVLQDPDGSILVVTNQFVARVLAGPSVAVLHRGDWRGLYPNSLARTANGILYVGMRHFVVRLRPTSTGYLEDWLVPPGTNEQADERAG